MKWIAFGVIAALLLTLVGRPAARARLTRAWVELFSFGEDLVQRLPEDLQQVLRDSPD